MERVRAAGQLWMLTVAVLWTGTASALDPARAINQYSIDTWTSREGLPQNAVETVVQTRDGYLWLGTQEGLARFDGVRFVVFDRSNTDPLASNFIQTLLPAHDGSLWVASFGGGLARLKDGVFHDYRLGGEGVYVTALAEDASGLLWVGTSIEGLKRFDGNSFTTLTTREGLPSDEVRAVLAGRRGDLWVGTTAGVAHIVQGEATVYGVKDGLSNDTVTALLEDGDALWIGTTQGLNRLKDGRITRYGLAEGLPHEYVRCLLVDRHGSLWIGTEGGGLARFRDGRFDTLTLRDGLTTNTIRSLIEDREGSLWIGTGGGGLDRLREGRAITFTTFHGLSTNDVYTVAGSRDGGLWIGSYDGEVDHYIGGRFVPLGSKHALAASRVRALYEDRSGRLWIGTDRGLFIYVHGTYTAYTTKDGLAQDVIRSIEEDREGNLWIGTDSKGISRFRDGHFTNFTQKDGLGSNEVRVVYQDPRGLLWVGTYGGLSRFQNGRFVTYTKRDGLSDTMVRALLGEADGTLWVGTYGGGLIRLKDGRFSSFTTRNGLLSDVIYQVLEDADGNLWMSCNKGVFRVAKRDLAAVAAGEKRTVSMTSYDEGDGMRSRECNGGGPGGAKTPDGRFWFSTLMGVVMLDPSRAPVNVMPPPVAVEEVLLQGRPLPGRGTVHVPPQPERLEFRFTALSFVAPKRVRFAYRLEGFDRDWVEVVSDRNAQYTHVPPGTYTFRVKACNNDGVWNEAGDRVTVWVAAAFYETWWFAVLVGISIVVAGFALYHLRIRQMRGYERLLEARIHDAVAKIKVLSGLLPICASCKKIRDDKGYWNQIEVYIRDHSEAQFSHSLCNECVRKLYPEVADEVLGDPD
jgi:ligand-binding sensor domain-containing protein